MAQPREGACDWFTLQSDWINATRETVSAQAYLKELKLP